MRNKKKQKNGIRLTAAGLILLMLFLFAGCGSVQPEEPEETLPQGPPRPEKVSETTIGSTGDILLHTPILDSVYDAETATYDFSEVFASVAPYYEEPDIMVANLEVTLGGEESGEFSGYPAFNSPDSIASALKDAGVDVLLTANNHSYDTGDYGLLRTQEVLDEDGFVHMGTRESQDDRYIYVTEKNGIRIGMTCYTYDTRDYTDGLKSLNGITMSEESADLVRSFSYSDPDELYESIRQDIYLMNMVGVDAKIFYMHWGTEYEDEPNADQVQIAQTMCDLGADVVIGGHPHVLQKFDVLESDDGHQTVCLYSMGNELSNQRASLMSEDGNRGYTEDGVIFQVVFEKFNNGKVKLRTVRAVPTWVSLSSSEDGSAVYEIVPLDADGTDGFSEEELASYRRTVGRLGEAYNNISRR